MYSIVKIQGLNFLDTPPLQLARRVLELIFKWTSNTSHGSCERALMPMLGLQGNSKYIEIFILSEILIQAWGLPDIETDFKTEEM